jgi:Major Facilitator Superfamily
MAASAESTAAPRNATFWEVFAEREYRALWVAQVVSIAGDQFARVALAVLVYDRTRSPLLAAVTFAVTAGAMFAGGLALGWMADRYPRRRVMVTSDVACVALVLVMAIPGLPIGTEIGLLFAVTLAVEPFLSARMAVNREVLGPDRFQLGTSITLATYQVAQLGGFAVGGVVAGLAGVHAALLIDAASFAASALLVRFGVKARAAPGGPARPGRPQMWAGVRLVFASPAARTAMLLMWLAAFFGAPEGVAVPLARQLGGGAATAGWLLAAMTAGAALALGLYTRLVAPARRMRLAAVMATAACAMLMLFVLPPALAPALAILAASGLFTGYIATASGALAGVIPDEHRGKVSGVVGAGMSLGQGVMMVAAGAAALCVSPALVVAACGAAGTAAAVPLLLAWRRVRPAR